MLRFFRYLVFAFVLLVVAAVWLKLLLTPVWVKALLFMPDDRGAPITHWERGWPATYQQDDGAGGQSFSWWLLAVDVGLALVVLTVVGALVIRRMRRPRSWNFSLRSLLIGTAADRSRLRLVVARALSLAGRATGDFRFICRWR